MDEQKPQLDYRGMEPVEIKSTITTKVGRYREIEVILRIIGDPMGLIEGHPHIRRANDVKQEPPAS